MFETLKEEKAQVKEIAGRREIGKSTFAGKLAQVQTPIPANTGEMSDFDALWRKFTAGVLWIRQKMKKDGLTDSLIEEMARFQKQIIDPMDALWQNMPAEERRPYLYGKPGA